MADGVDNRVARVGGITYVQLPALDPGASAAFYQTVFGWDVHGRPEHPSFDDGTGHVIGAWVTTRAVTPGAGPLVYIFVERVRDTIDKAVAAGAEVVREPYEEGNLLVAVLRDVAGTEIGVWQEGHA